MRDGVFSVGLTGGIASGKSTAARFFGALGVPIIDTEQVIRQGGAGSQPSLQRLTRRFGLRILLPDGRLDRGALRAILCSDVRARADFEVMCHPAIGPAVESASAQAGGPYQIFVIRQLIEHNLVRYLDRVLVVDCDEETQISRIQARDGTSKEGALALLNTQLSRAARLRIAHDVIRTEGDLSIFQQQVAARHDAYLALARETGRRKVSQR